ncbi:hypothetical protein ACM66B_005972 [Microbotryomycetes sp. NB124-2]
MPPKQRTPHKQQQKQTIPAASEQPKGTSSKTSVGAVSASYGTSTSANSATRSSPLSSSFSESVSQLWSNYVRDTPRKLQLCDGFQLFLMLMGIAQFVYCILITNYPFNAFIGG